MDKDLDNFTTELIDALNNAEDLYGFLFTVQTVNAAGVNIETLEVRSEDGMPDISSAVLASNKGEIQNDDKRCRLLYS